MPKTIYPIMIVCLIGIFILFLIWSGFQASTQGTQVTDRDYYSKGLKYNSTQVEKRAATTMGWNLATDLDRHLLNIKLFDGNRSPVANANGILQIYSRPDSDQLAIQLTEPSPGQYTAELPEHLQGELTIRVEFEREGARLNRQLLINLR